MRDVPVYYYCYYKRLPPNTSVEQRVKHIEGVADTVTGVVVAGNKPVAVADTLVMVSTRVQREL